MTNITGGSENHIFHSKGDIVDYLLSCVLANQKRKIGTELEMFLLDREGKAITRQTGQLAFALFKQVFALKGYASSFIYERDIIGNQSIFGVDVFGLGTITPEIGHQFEFACSVCDTTDEIREKNAAFFEAVEEVAARLNHVPVYCGHIPDYVTSTEGSYRSRSVEWHNYFKQRSPRDYLKTCETLDATASTQVSIDSGADNFHEFFQALLLIEPALTLHYANSKRPNISVVNLPPSHIQPIIGVWGTKSTQQAIQVIVDRLMNLEVPFLPDPIHPQIYKSEPLSQEKPPTVGKLMEFGRLNQKTLNNIGGFLLSRPAIRRFPQGVIEVRGVDAQASPEMVARVAQNVQDLVYNDAVRKRLLSDYMRLNPTDILKLHRASAHPDPKEALQISVSGMKMVDFVDDILTRCKSCMQNNTSSLAKWENRATA